MPRSRQCSSTRLLFLQPWLLQDSDLCLLSHRPGASTPAYVLRLSNPSSHYFSLNISSECASALTKLEISSDAQCLDISGVIGLFSTNGSVLSVTNKWLSTLCNQTACTNSSLAAVVTALTEGCSTELSELSAPSNLTTYVRGNYRILRDIGCLRKWVFYLYLTHDC